MSILQPISLTPVRTAPGKPEFQAILTWPFAEQPFYEGQVKRLLQKDIPHRVMYGFCLVWVYRDPDGNVVGFGTLDVCKDYERFTGGKYHAYIPLLAVNPEFQKRGHGRSIVQHLIAEAVLIAQSPAGFSDLLFLDVYTANQGAISLYEKCGFVTLNPDAPILDPQENNAPYVIMAQKVAVAPAGAPPK
jgi:ribosomal protein S18 acetylase RimI-like enzyme